MLVAWSAPTDAATLIVNSLNDNTTAGDGACTLREAIVAAAGGHQRPLATGLWLRENSSCQIVPRRPPRPGSYTCANSPGDRSCLRLSIHSSVQA